VCLPSFTARIFSFVPTQKNFWQLRIDLTASDLRLANSQNSLFSK